MKLVRHMGHTVRKLGHVGLKGPIGCSSRGPTVIQNNISISEISEAIINNFLGRIQEKFLANVAAKGVPVILANIS